MNLEDFTAEALRPHVGSHFHVSGPEGQAVDLLLEEVKVTTHEQHPSSQLARDPFSLFFVGPAQAFLRQSIYTVQHDALGGTWQIFLVPVAQRTAGEFLYEAAFT
jgi:hypothetical protein